ncbi:NmrA/HSCARG family protein [Streptomyces werraensis]|uniref:NmrA/HSCARG family protein n=1 Tax=Streptomyces werraensis TaxID=68284 RepID=UPI001CE34560
MSIRSAPVLVTGATGKQGGATVQALLTSGVPVRALVRDPTSAPAQTIEAFGAELVTGDLLDRDSVMRAVEGTRAVFSVQIPPATAEGFDFGLEAVQGINLIEGARAAGVSHFVQSTASGVGQHTRFPGWAEGRWAPMEPYYTAKNRIQDRLRDAGFPAWTLLKPGFFMDNLPPAMRFFFPRGIEGGLVSIVKPDTMMSLVAVRDIGTAAAAAISAPERFHKVELELASDYLSMAQIAKILTRVLGVPLSAPDIIMEDAIATGMPPMGAAHKLYNVVGQPARPQYARELGIPLTDFEEWARRSLS